MPYRYPYNRYRSSRSYSSRAYPYARGYNRYAPGNTYRRSGNPAILGYRQRLGYRVRDKVLSMTGARTVQSNNVYSLGSGTQLTIQTDMALMDPVTIRDHMEVAAGSSKKFYVRHAEHSVYYANATNTNLIVRAYRLTCIKNCPADLAQLVSDDAPSSTIPYIDVSTSNALRRYFRIEESRMDVIRPESARTYRLEVYYPEGKLVDGEVEGNPLKFAYAVGSVVWMIFVNTHPIEDAPSGYKVGASFPKLNCIDRTKYVWYPVKDNESLSSALNGVSGISSGFVISDSTRTQFVNDQN